MYEDQDSLFGSPPPSPRFQTASICDNERRLGTSTDTQNVGTIALPGSHYSELPLNPLALSLNHTTVHRPPAQSQDQQTTVSQNTQPSRDPEFSFPDPSELPPAHFLRNQQNLLGIAGLVAGVKPSTITHIRGTSINPIVVDDEDTPTLGRPSRDSRHHYPDPSFLAAPTNEDIVSVLIAQKDLFPVLDGILGIIGKRSTRPTPTASSLPQNDSSEPPPVKRRKLHRVPAGAADWDIPYPFQEGDGPDEYHKTWERKRAKDLVLQLVNIIKSAARKAAIKNHLQSSTPGNMAPRVGEEGKGKEKEKEKETQLTGIVLPSSYEQQPEHPKPTPTPTPTPEPEPEPVPVPVPAPSAPRPKNTIISQSRKEEILRGAREKRKQVQEELDRVKTQLWESTIEQAALVHLLKRYDSENEQGGTVSN